MHGELVCLDWAFVFGGGLVRDSRASLQRASYASSASLDLNAQAVV